MTMDDGQRRQAHRCLQHLHEAQQVLEAHENVVRRDSLPQEGLSRDAARQDCDEPHPTPTGCLDIRVPIPDGDGRLPWDRERGNDRVEGPGVGFGMSALPRAGHR
jgi:hypothetical protein